MTPALACVLLRLAVPVTLGMAHEIEHDPCFRAGVQHVRLGPNACHYLRSETWTPAHPKARFDSKGRVKR